MFSVEYAPSTGPAANGGLEEGGGGGGGGQGSNRLPV